METGKKGLVDVAVNVGGKSNHTENAAAAEGEKGKKGLVDVAVNVGGKSIASGKVAIGSTDKNKKGLVDISVNVGGKSQESEGETDDENQAAADTAPQKGLFAFSLSLFPSMADGLLKIGVDVLKGKSRGSRRRHKRHGRDNASEENE